MRTAAATAPHTDRVGTNRGGTNRSTNRSRAPTAEHHARHKTRTLHTRTAWLRHPEEERLARSLRDRTSSQVGVGPGGPPSSDGSLAAPGTPKDVDSAATPKTGMGRFLGAKNAEKDPTGGVLDKLKTDFGGGKKAER